MEIRFIDNIKNKIISDWKDTVKSELYITFDDNDLHAVAIPAPVKGILAEATEDTIRSFIYTKNVIGAWYYSSFQDGVGRIEPSNLLNDHIMYSGTYHMSDVFIILKPKMLRYSRVNRIISELDGDICSGFFKIIRNVDRTCRLKVNYSTSAEKLHFIFLYDKKTKKKAKNLERIILEAYDKGGTLWTRN